MVPVEMPINRIAVSDSAACLQAGCNTPDETVSDVATEGNEVERAIPCVVTVSKKDAVRRKIALRFEVRASSLHPSI
ncbi:hypothetical protein GCM10023219_20060 [Stakelama sediminis]